MRKLTIATLLLLAHPAFADDAKKPAGDDAALAGVRLAIDKADEALNRGDAKSLVATWDKRFVYAGSGYSDSAAGLDATKASVEKMLANGPVFRLTRGATTIQVDEEGHNAWYVAEYMLVPKVGPGVLARRRQLRESGVLIKRGKDWKFAMVHSSYPEPDPRPPAPPAPAPGK